MSTFAELRTEFFARGFSYLNDAGAGLVRAKAFTNMGYRDLVECEPWPWRETTASPTTAPITSITDLGDLISVSTATGTLPLVDGEELRETDALLTQTGTARYVWIDGASTIRTWPVDASTSLTVRYRKTSTDMSGDSDTPSLVPTRWQPLIVDFAVIRALRDKSNYAEAAAVRQGIEEDLDRMRETYFDRFDVWQQTAEQSNA